MTKRNSYFAQFEITTITFTDDDLSDLDDCFKRIQHHLSKRATQKVSLRDQLARLRKA